MRAEVVSIGSELLLGQIVDTNAAFIARHLASIGLDLFHKVTVGDNLGRAAATLVTALERADVVITTGGLGPTADDVTREAVAQATGRALVLVPELLQEIEAFFRARGFTLSPSNQKQAYIPEGANSRSRTRWARPPASSSSRAGGLWSAFRGSRGRWSSCSSVA